jgi:hypothetical protein
MSANGLQLGRLAGGGRGFDDRSAGIKNFSRTFSLLIESEAMLQMRTCSARKTPAVLLYSFQKYPNRSVHDFGLIRPRNHRRFMECICVRATQQPQEPAEKGCECWKGHQPV